MITTCVITTCGPIIHNEESLPLLRITFLSCVVQSSILQGWGYGITVKDTDPNTFKGLEAGDKASGI